MPDKTYQCDECGETFASPQRIASHANSKGHDVNADQSTPVTPALLRDTLSNLRFGRDTDGDGKLDIAREKLQSQVIVLMVGIVIGHTLAHDPSSAFKIVTGASGAWGVGNVLSKSRLLPIPSAWFDSDAMSKLWAGIIFGVALVVLPWEVALDAVMHALGSGHAPGAH